MSKKGAVIMEMTSDLRVNAVNNIKQQLEMTLSKDIVKFLDERTRKIFTSIMTSKDNVRYVLRLSLSPESNYLIEQEKTIYQLAKENGLKSFPEVFNTGQTFGLSWFLYHFIDGQICGNTYQFDDSIEIDLVLDFLTDEKKLSQVISVDKVSLIYDQKHWNNLVLRVIDEAGGINSFLPNEKIIIEKIHSHIKDIKDLSLVHADFHPANVFLTADGVKVIDWESARFASPATDYAFVWLRCFDEKKRELVWSRLLENYPEIEREAKIVFAIFTLRDLAEWRSISAGKSELLKKNDLLNNAKIEDIILDLHEQLIDLSKSL
jgi:serine/threonine protein kinase